MELENYVTKYKEERRRTSSLKRKLQQVVELQLAADTRPIPPERGDLIAAASNKTLWRREAIREDITGLEMTIGNLQNGLTRDLVSMNRVIPDGIRGRMEDRLLPSLEEQQRLEPGRAGHL